MIELLKQPWPWYTSGIIIAAIMVLLLYFGKSFGFSSNLRTICSIAGAGKQVKLFDFDWKAQRWNLMFLIGAVLGGFISSVWLKSDQPMQLSAATVADLQKLHIRFDGQLNPEQLFGTTHLGVKNMALLLVGGLLVGFGSRYAGGCTSGHAISGLSNLQLPSLVAVLGFFAGGLIMTWIVFPLIF
ncbi:YeeE/YedE thiosulfate transporter family protein [Mucilaginibacter sp. 10I4]|uniref:YeeE/YedE family protein n=1 Tax=Mucilaginibacter sp. 10I4 TaxID=3048580 RepID=UPI002B227476|nr:YeeE/YedE thiosulfate transporter family protein [Mucilaginibacter sp. 10I4]MEB0260718.1 YeeE/YedE thiosulfate transporter family protein [Mucilaginibacter sp. 10I4]